MLEFLLIRAILKKKLIDGTQNDEQFRQAFGIATVSKAGAWRGIAQYGRGDGGRRRRDNTVVYKI